jgi:hypothetical protein
LDKKILFQGGEDLLCSHYECKEARHYFEAHTIRVLIKQPQHEIFRNRDNSRRIGKWATELSEYIVDFEKLSAIKLQILANFMAD